MVLVKCAARPWVVGAWPAVERVEGNRTRMTAVSQNCGDRRLFPRLGVSLDLARKVQSEVI
jgi:hypothetical protein